MRQMLRDICSVTIALVTFARATNAPATFAPATFALATNALGVIVKAFVNIVFSLKNMSCMSLHAIRISDGM